MHHGEGRRAGSQGPPARATAGRCKGIRDKKQGDQGQVIQGVVRTKQAARAHQRGYLQSGEMESGAMESGVMELEATGSGATCTRGWGAPRAHQRGQLQAGVSNSGAAGTGVT